MQGQRWMNRVFTVTVSVVIFCRRPQETEKRRQNHHSEERKTSIGLEPGRLL